MDHRTRLHRVAALVLLVVTVLLLVQPSRALPPPPPVHEFAPMAIQGFGDMDNSAAWSMQWWKGKLYVGTVREFDCWVLAALNKEFPQFFPYPPNDPDKHCAPNVSDLNVQAEIWRYTPETSTWELVFRSPKNVPVPGEPGKFTGRDVGFRGMTVFTEPDGTEALYVSGVYPRVINPDGAPEPRILRSTDGLNFEPIPLDLGGAYTGFRGLVSYKGRLYVVASSTNWGSGPVLEFENPPTGEFRQVTPPDLEIFELIPYNGYLYVGTSTRLQGGGTGEWPGDQEIEHRAIGAALPEASEKGFSVLKTDATGEPPYTFTPIIEEGGYRRRPADSVASMHVFDGRLYLGTDAPAEMLRINPDDSWDLIVGRKRKTPDGWKYAKSGMGPGFGWRLNVHIWRMEDFGGALYAGTLDAGMRFHNIEWITERIGHTYGFDLYASQDGAYFSAITTDGFGNQFDTGIRTFASTPKGLFVGGVNYWQGLQVWREAAIYRAYLPSISLGSDGSSLGSQALTRQPSRGEGQAKSSGLVWAPGRLEADVGSGSGQVVLSWDPLPDRNRGQEPGAPVYHVYRSAFTSNRLLGIPDLDGEAWVPEPFTEVGTTSRTYFVDPDATPSEGLYHYYVVAGDTAGNRSPASNLAPAPSEGLAVTFGGLKEMVVDWAARGRASGAGGGGRYSAGWMRHSIWRSEAHWTRARAGSSSCAGRSNVTTRRSSRHGLPRTWRSS